MGANTADIMYGSDMTRPARLSAAASAMQNGSCAPRREAHGAPGGSGCDDE